MVGQPSEFVIRCSLESPTKLRVKKGCAGLLPFFHTASKVIEFSFGTVVGNRKVDRVGADQYFNARVTVTELEFSLISCFIPNPRPP